MRNFRIAQIMRDRGGNFGIMTAAMLPLILGIGGVAMDLAQAIEMKSQIQGTADSAALAAASAMANKGLNETDAQKLAKDYLTSQLLRYVETGKETAAEKTALEQAIRNATTASTTTGTTSSGKNYSSTITTNYAMPLNPLTSLVVGSRTMQLSATSTAGSSSVSQTAISMYLVLDRSGSMSFVTDQKNTTLSTCANYDSDSWPNPYSYTPCYIRKIQALQTAAKALFDSLNTADPTTTLTRVGADTFTDSTQTASAVAWGTSSSQTYINALPSVPTGGTDASGALTNAFNALKVANTTEATAHTSKSTPNFQR